MTGQLNTTVNGSPGTCTEAADWFNALNESASAAGDHAAAANTASGNWRGPASEAYIRSMRGVGPTCDDLAFTAREYRRALLEFSTLLEKVLERMHNARMDAVSAGLKVDGPFILPPKPLGPAPKPPSGTMTLGEVGEAMASFRGEQNAYAADVAEYNRKVREFNKCSELVQEARNKEDEAHANLRDTLKPPEGKLDAFKIGNETLGTLVAAVEIAENERFDALRNAKLLASEGKTFQQFAMGTLSTIDAKDAALLRLAGEKAGLGAAHYLKRAEDFDKLVREINPKIRTVLAAYPGKGKVGPDASVVRKFAGGAGKYLPYVGSLLVGINEARGAVKGEQTWEKAAIRTGGVLAGAGAGAKLGAAAGTAVEPGGGTVIGGVVGGFVGGIVGEEAVDMILGEDERHEQPKAEQMRYRPEEEDALGDVRISSNPSIDGLDGRKSGR